MNISKLWNCLTSSTPSIPCKMSDIQNEHTEHTSAHISNLSAEDILHMPEYLLQCTGAGHVHSCSGYKHIHTLIQTVQLIGTRVQALLTTTFPLSHHPDVYVSFVPSALPAPQCSQEAIQDPHRGPSAAQCTGRSDAQPTCSAFLLELTVLDFAKSLNLSVHCLVVTYKNACSFWLDIFQCFHSISR